MQSKLIHHTDNRNYDYSSWENENRAEYDYIVKLIEPNKKLIDLGCGNGSLMQRLIKEKNSDVTGIEISESAVNICRKKGLNIQQGKIDTLIPFENDSFDYSICNVTLQMVLFPEILLKEMKRISKYQIISFPNFAFIKNRIDLLLRGRMPQPMLYKYKWYNTGHIHQLSIRDFYELLNDIKGLKILKHEYVKTENSFYNFLMNSFPNLFQQIAIFLLTKK